MPSKDTHTTERPQAIRLGTLRRFASSITVDYLEADRVYALGLLGLGPEPTPLGTVTAKPDGPSASWTDLAGEIGLAKDSKFEIGLLRAIRGLDTALHDGEPVEPVHGFRLNRDCPYPIVLEEL